MKWTITSFIFATGNVVLMLMFADSRLGRTPYFLPLFISIITSLLAIMNIVSAFKFKKEEHGWIHRLCSAVAWAIATAFNIWAQQGVWYVA